MSLRLRRGTDAERQAVTFLEGELVYTTDTKKLFVGDGTTAGGVSVDSALGSINSLSDVDTAGIAVGQVLQWNGSNFIPGYADRESVFGQDSTLLVDAINSSINLDGTVKGDIIPDTNIAYDLGSTSNRFRDLYLSGTTIDLGGTTISTTGGKVNFSVPVQAEFELNQNMDLKNYYITSTDASPNISVRPGTNADFNVATVAGVKLFEVDLDTNTYGTPAGEKTVLQLPVFSSNDYTAHGLDEAIGQLVFDNPSKTLKVYNGTDWVTVQGTGGGGGAGIVEGQEYNINIQGNVVGDDSTIIVNHNTNEVNGDIVVARTEFRGDLVGDIISSDSGIVLDTSLARLTGDVHGTSGAVLTSNSGPSDARLDAFRVDATEINGALTGNVIGNVTGNVTATTGTSSFFAVTTANNLTVSGAGSVTGDLTVNGNLIANGNITGDVDGDVQGSIFAENSSVLVDAIAAEINGRINTDLESYFEGPVNFGKNTSTNHKVQYFSTSTNGSFSDSVINVANVHNDATYCNELGLFRARGTVDAQTSAAVNDLIGTLSWAAYDGTAPQIANAIKSQVTAISANNVTADMCFYVRNGLIGTFTKTLTIQGSTNGGMVSEAFIQFGSYTTTERDALTAANGMVLYNSTDNKFQGYENGAWVNLV